MSSGSAVGAVGVGVKATAVAETVVGLLSRR